jgi:hypothetical protein
MRDPVMELKLICQCGQKYKFDVEPVNGQMPFTVNCPICKLDGTSKANEMLALRTTTPPVAGHTAAPPPPPPPVGGIRINQGSPAASPAPVPVSMAAAPAPPPLPPMAGLRINKEAPAPISTIAPPPLSSGSPPPPIAGMRTAREQQKINQRESGQFSLVRGILGAVIGAVVGCGLMYAFYEWAHFRFPLMGIAVGVAVGYGARWLARGTENTMGVISGAIAGVSVVGTFWLMYGDFAIFNIISIVICIGVAYRASSE